MVKVITINDWWDGPKLGLACFNGLVCIYERLFDEAADDWSDIYFLTPIDSEAEKRILIQWEAWCNAVKSNTINKYFENGTNSVINTELHNSPKYHMCKCKAKFHGHFEKGFIPDDYYVEWIEKC